MLRLPIKYSSKNAWSMARPQGTRAKERLKITEKQAWQTLFRPNSKHIKKELIILKMFF